MKGKQTSPFPTEREQDSIVGKLLEMRRAGRFHAIWPANRLGVPVREEPYGQPQLISWRRAAELVRAWEEEQAKPVVVEIRKPSRRRAV